MNDTQLPIPIIPADRRLTAAEFQGLAEVPPELGWFRNLSNAGTERVYRNAIADFMRFTGIVRPEEFRIVTRAHVIEWRKDLERREIGHAGQKKNPARCTIRNRLAALSSLFEYLCEKNAVSHNPVKGVKRPKAESGEGTTPTIGDHQARQLLAAPATATVKAIRDRAILSTLSTTRCGAKSSASSRSRISIMRAAACRISKSKARAKTRAICRCQRTTKRH
jgi:integrase/recombinase XerD